jgi:hypothetical protein
MGSEARKPANLLGLYQSIELLPQLARKVTIANQHACFNIALLRPFGEVRGRDERVIVIRDHALGMPRRANDGIS